MLQFFKEIDLGHAHKGPKECCGCIYTLYVQVAKALYDRVQSEGFIIKGTVRGLHFQIQK